MCVYNAYIMIHQCVCMYTLCKQADCHHQTCSYCVMVDLLLLIYWSCSVSQLGEERLPLWLQLSVLITLRLCTYCTVSVGVVSVVHIVSLTTKHHKSLIDWMSFQNLPPQI